MIVYPNTEKNTPYRAGSKKATIFNLITSIEPGESLTVEKFDFGFGQYLAFDGVQRTISEICSAQKHMQILVKTKVIDSKLVIYRVE